MSVVIVVSLCPDHGLFIENDETGVGGCPVQIAPDGTTCGHGDKHPRAFRLLGERRQ